MPRNGIYNARGGLYTTRGGVYALGEGIAETIESFPDYPEGDGTWHSPTWSGDARHISEVDDTITRSGDGALWMRGYFEDWALPHTFDTTPALGRPMRCWLYAKDWNSEPDTGTQYWFTVGHPEEDNRNYRLELNLIHNGTFRVRYRNGNAKTVDDLDGNTAHINNAHNALEDTWYAIDLYSPGSRAIESAHYDEGEMIRPGDWQAVLHEDGEQDNPIIINFSFDDYQSWPGDELKVGTWVGYAQDQCIWDEIQYLPEAPAPEPSDPDTLIIDDFEDYGSGDLVVNWTLDGTGSADVSSDAALHDESSQGVVQSGTSQIRSFPGQGLDNYPEDGVETSILCRLDGSTRQPRIFLALQDDTWSTETDCWIMIIRPDGGLELRRGFGSGGSEREEENSSVNFSVGDTLDCRFVADSSNGVEFWLQDMDGNNLGSVSTTSTDLIEDEMSLGLRSAQSVQWDWATLVDEE